MSKSTQALCLKNKRSVTFIEILLVMTLIALISGAFSFSLHQMQKQERFYRSVDEALTLLQTAEQMMIERKDTLNVTLYKNQGKVLMHLLADNPSQLKKSLEDKTITLNVDDVFFRQKDEINTMPFTLTFSSLQQAIPRGVLILTSGHQKKGILMKGYPHPLQTVNENYVLKNEPSFETLYPIDIVHDTQK